MCNSDVGPIFEHRQNMHSLFGYDNTCVVPAVSTPKTFRFVIKNLYLFKKRKKELPGVIAHLFMLRRQRQAGHLMFKISLLFIASSKLSRAAQLALKKKTKRKEEKVGMSN